MFLVLSIIATAILGTVLLLVRVNHRIESDAARAALSTAERRGRFVLYLRAFDADEQWSNLPAPSWGIWGLFGVVLNFFQHPAFSRTVRFERFVRRMTAKTFKNMPVVAVASQGEALGIGRVSVDAYSWKNDVTALCADARAIVFLVGGSSGLAWELLHILESRHLNKTVFVIPPWDIMQRQYGVAAEVIIKRARDIFLAQGIDLPRPNWSGRVFVLSDTKVKTFVGDIAPDWSSDRQLLTAMSSLEPRPIFDDR